MVASGCLPSQLRFTWSLQDGLRSEALFMVILDHHQEARRRCGAPALPCFSSFGKHCAALFMVILDHHQEAEGTAFFLKARACFIKHRVALFMVILDHHQEAEGAEHQHALPSERRPSFRSTLDGDLGSPSRTTA